MASLITHPLVPVSLAAMLGRQVIPLRLLLAGVVLAMLPDADVGAFALDIPYASPWGHRGFMHSVATALVCASLPMTMARWFRAPPALAFSFLFASMLSHDLLDACTDGGLGVALWWPLTDTRYFFAHHPIRVSPIGVGHFIGARGWTVLRSEMLWVWTPLAGIGAVGCGLRHVARQRKAFAGRRHATDH